MKLERGGKIMNETDYEPLKGKSYPIILEEQLQAL